jgi:[acyl-carrier-protein] S-malonyltransferase
MKPNIVVIFPGQGSQKAHMAQNFLNSEYKDLALDYFDRAKKKLGFDLLEISLEADDETLKKTQYTQPALFTYGMINFHIFKEQIAKKNLKTNLVLGHSVGELTALCAAEYFSFEDGVLATYLRGKSMQEAAPLGIGSMYAILRSDSQIIEKACEDASNEDETVVCANFNTPEQIVISGHTNACVRAVALISEMDPKARAVELNVSAPFHSPLMKNAAVQLEAFLQSIKTSENSIDYIANIDAQIHPSGTLPALITQALVLQVYSPVKWFQSVAQIPVDALIFEMGPGKVLKGLSKKINKQLNTFSFEEDSDIYNTFL